MKTLRGIGLELSDVSRFVLIGGASRAAMVQQFWTERLQGSKQKLVTDQMLRQGVDSSRITIRSNYTPSASLGEQETQIFVQ